MKRAVRACGQESERGGGRYASSGRHRSASLSIQQTEDKKLIELTLSEG